MNQEEKANHLVAIKKPLSAMANIIVALILSVAAILCCLIMRPGRYWYDKGVVFDRKTLTVHTLDGDNYEMRDGRYVKVENRPIKFGGYEIEYEDSNNLDAEFEKKYGANKKPDYSKMSDEELLKPDEIIFDDEVKTKGGTKSRK